MGIGWDIHLCLEMLFAYCTASGHPFVGSANNVGALVGQLTDTGSFPFGFVLTAAICSPYAES